MHSYLLLYVFMLPYLGINLMLVVIFSSYRKADEQVLSLAMQELEDENALSIREARNRLLLST